MKVLIIGGTGFIGKAICEHALAEGHEVTLFSRGQTPHSLDVNLIRGHVDNLVNFKEQIRAQNFDVAVHCIAYTEQHARDAVETFAATPTHLIVMSSCDGYEAFQGLNRKIDKAELPINEDSPLSLQKYYWSDTATKGSLAETYDKNLMTDILIRAFDANKIDVTVFRLVMIYGPHDRQYPARHGAFIRRIIDRRRTLILSDREQCQVFSYGYVGNIAAATVHSFRNRTTFGKIYNLGDRLSRSKRRWAELYAKLSGWEFDIHILPEELIRKDRSLRNAPPQHLLVDSSLFARETNFTEPFSIEQAVSKTLDFAQKHPDVLGERDDYRAEEALLDNYLNKINEIHKDAHGIGGLAF